MEVDARTIRALEWDRLRHYLAGETSCRASAKLALELTPEIEPAVVRQLLAETTEGLSLVANGATLSQEGLPDAADMLRRLEAGAQLGLGHLVELRSILVASRATHKSLSLLVPADFPELAKFIGGLAVLQDLITTINDAIDDQGFVRDDASGLLKRLRKDVVRLSAAVQVELQRIINSQTLAKALQEPICTQRNGRWVLPVQASMRGQIQGIVHDTSSSGLTVFVEPLSVVELSNKVRLSESEIEREIERILAELSAQAHVEHERINQSFASLVELDFIGARARLAHKCKAAPLEILPAAAFELRQVRHPLMVLQDASGARDVVANDLSLGGATRTMLITGPNTGGKTVLLKTIGLVVLMIQSGLLPAAASSKCGIFTAIFADIGDEQSIEQNLSTFSAHMTNIIDIVKGVDKRSLILLDEVGAGTDPREGTVLARVILERLNECAAVTIASTHYSDLKTVAHTTAGFINASLDFNEATLSPTYQLRLGVPGSSKALTIAERLGLERSLVSRAHELLASNSGDVTAILQQLEERLRLVSLAEQEAQAKLAEAGELERRFAEKLSQVEDARQQVRGTFALKIEGEVTAARDLIRQTIADLQRQPSSQKAKEAQEAMQVLTSELGWLQPPALEEIYTGALVVGQEVKVHSLNKLGVIEELSAPDATGGKGQAVVRAGMMKIKVPVSDLSPVPVAPKTKQRGATAAQTKSARSAKSAAAPQVFVRGQSNTLDLRGQRVDEALANLEKFLDQAFRDQRSPLMVIHGHGMGKVKSAVRQYLKECGYQNTFRPGENYEGGDGVSIVFFDL